MYAFTLEIAEQKLIQRWVFTSRTRIILFCSTFILPYFAKVVRLLLDILLFLQRFVINLLDFQLVRFNRFRLYLSIVDQLLYSRVSRHSFRCFHEIVIRWMKFGLSHSVCFRLSIPSLLCEKERRKGNEEKRRIFWKRIKDNECKKG